MKKTIWCALCALLALPALALAQSHSAMSPLFTVDTRDATPVIYIHPAAGLGFGSQAVNTDSSILYFTVRNDGSGTLSGNASIAAAISSFSIVSGASYSLGPGQTHQVGVRFRPPSGGNYEDTISFSGGGSASAIVTGTGVVSSDTNSPVLAIIQPTENSTVTNASLTIIGTATDSGRGNSGIKGVWVGLNGGAPLRASGDTASGSGTANWSRTVTLQPGPNTISVIARDNSPAENAMSLTRAVTYQAGSVNGLVRFRVTNQQNGNVVSGARVELMGYPPVISDADGWAEFTNIPATSGYMLTVEAQGYERLISRGMNFPPGVNNVNVTLTPQVIAGRVTPLTAINQRLGSTPSIEQGGRLVRWYQGANINNGQPRSDLEVSVFRRKKGSGAAWAIVPQPAAAARGSTMSQRMLGHFPVYAEIPSPVIGDVHEFKVFYPPIMTYSESVAPVESFECRVTVRNYVHGFENQTDASLGIGLNAVKEVSAGPYIAWGRDLLYPKTTSANQHDRLVLSKKHSKGLEVGVGAALGAGLRVNDQSFGAYAGAGASGRAGLYVRNDYEYARADTTINSALAKLFIYYNPGFSSLAGFTPVGNSLANLDPLIASLLHVLSSKVSGGQFEHPLIYSSSGVALEGVASAEAFAGGVLGSIQVSGDISASISGYGRLGVGQLPRINRTFLEAELGSGVSASGNLLVRELQDVIRPGTAMNDVKNGLGFHAGASGNLRAFARAILHNDRLVILMGRRVQAGASFQADFYSWSKQPDPIYRNELRTTEFTISADSSALEGLVENNSLLKGLMAGKGIKLDRHAILWLLTILNEVAQQSRFMVTVEEQAASYDEISALDVALRLSAILNIDGSYAGTYNRMTQFVSGRGFWHVGGYYLTQDYSNDTRHHLVGGSGSHSYIPVNNGNVSTIPDGPQVWMDQVRDVLAPSLAQLTQNVVAGAVTVLQNPSLTLTLGANALAGNIVQVGVTLGRALTPSRTRARVAGRMAKSAEESDDRIYFGIGGYVMMDPPGAVLSAPSTLTINYSDSELDDWPESSLAMYRYDEETRQWVHVGGTVDTVNNRVTASINVLGTYTLAAEFPYGEIALNRSSSPLSIEFSFESNLLRMNNGSTVPDGTEFIVTTTDGSISPSEILQANGGYISFDVENVDQPGDVLISVRSLHGLAYGSTNKVVLDDQPPVEPTSIEAFGLETSVEVSWEPSSSSDVSAYRIYYREGVAGPPYDGKASAGGIDSPVPVGPFENFAIIEGLLKDRVYYITVTAVDAVGNESPLPDPVVAQTSEQPPRPPASVFVNWLGGTNREVEITWSPSPDDFGGAQDVVRYEVFRMGDGLLQPYLGATTSGVYRFVDALPADYRSYSISYYVRAVDDGQRTNDSTSELLLFYPDLLVESIRHTPHNPLPGDPVTFYVTLRNAGENVASYGPYDAFFNTGFWLNKASPPSMTDSSDYLIPFRGALEVGEVVELTMEITAPSAGTYRAWAFADYGENNGEIEESDEWNNVGPSVSGYGYEWTVTEPVPPHATISLQAEPLFGGSVNGGGTYPVGSTQTISASANAGYSFTTWSDSNTNAIRAVMVPPGGATFTASFALIPTRIIGLSGDLAFGNVTTGRTAQLELVITNSGNSALTVTGISYPAGFSGAWSGTVAAGRSTNVTVTFAPNQARGYSGTITVNSDRTGGTHTRTCSGTGIPAEKGGWDADSTSLNVGDWRNSLWFGDYTPMGGGWIFHNRHGFWFAFPDSTPDSIFFWSMDMGWLWTSSTTYTYLYCFDEGTWLYYEPNSEDQTRRWFLNMSNGQWEEWPLWEQ